MILFLRFILIYYWIFLCCHPLKSQDNKLHFNIGVYTSGIAMKPSIGARMNSSKYWLGPTSIELGITKKNKRNINIQISKYNQFNKNNHQYRIGDANNLNFFIFKLRFSLDYFEYRKLTFISHTGIAYRTGSERLYMGANSSWESNSLRIYINSIGPEMNESIKFSLNKNINFKFDISLNYFINLYHSELNVDPDMISKFRYCNFMTTSQLSLGITLNK